MRINRRTAIGLLSATALGWSALTGALAAFGDNGNHDGQTLLRSTLAPSVLSDPTIHGAARGGVPWQIDSSQVRLRHDGRLTLSVRGLVIPGNGTTGPVTTIKAGLFCGADNTAAVATTDAVPISSDGNAQIDQRIALPQKCLAPIVLVHPNGNSAAYIAASGFQAG